MAARLANSARAAARLAYASASRSYPTAAAARRIYSSATTGTYHGTFSYSSSFFAPAARRAAAGTNAGAGRCAAAYGTKAAAETAHALDLDVPSGEDIHPAASTAGYTITRSTLDAPQRKILTLDEFCEEEDDEGCNITRSTLDAPQRKILTLDEFYEEDDEGFGATNSDLDELELTDDYYEGLPGYSMYGVHLTNLEMMVYP